MSGGELNQKSFFDFFELTWTEKSAINCHNDASRYDVILLLQVYFFAIVGNLILEKKKRLLEMKICEKEPQQSSNL